MFKHAESLLTLGMLLQVCTRGMRVEPDPRTPKAYELFITATAGEPITEVKLQPPVTSWPQHF